MGTIPVSSCKRRTVGIAVWAISGLASFPAFATDVFVAGPVEQINVAQREVVVLGQTVRLSQKQLSRLQWMAGSQRLAGYQAYVEVAGTSALDGVIQASSFQGGAPYVAGSSAIAVRNFVTKATNSRGHLTIGSLRVDASAVDSGTQVGDLVEVAGIQPNAGGVAFATIFRQVQGVIGSGTSGVIGSGDR